MRVLDLFSGIGGFSLGLERAGMETVAFCEISEKCRRVLKKHWPDVPQAIDIRKLTYHSGILFYDGAPIYAGPIDLICGGFPCQDISISNTKGLGLDGERSGLWSEYFRLVCEVRPQFIIVENVAAILHRGCGRVLGDLAGIGFDAEWLCIPAAAIGLPHARNRFWAIAYPKGKRWEFSGEIIKRIVAEKLGERGFGKNVRRVHSEILRCLPYARNSGDDAWLSRRVDGLSMYGNSVAPGIPELIGRAIMELETN